MTLYNRICNTCYKGINDGYIYDGGCFCSLECAGLTEAQWGAMYDDDGDNYYTEWDDDPSDEATVFNQLNAFVYAIDPSWLDDETLEKIFSKVLDEQHN